jgi:hypothetical protein
MTDHCHYTGICNQDELKRPFMRKERMMYQQDLQYPPLLDNKNDGIVDYHSETISRYNALASGVLDEQGVLPGTDLVSLQAYGQTLSYILAFAVKMIQDVGLFHKTWSYGRCQWYGYILIYFPRGGL